MISKGARECFVYIALPGQTEFVTAARFAPVARAAGVSEADCERIGSAFVYRAFASQPTSGGREPLVSS